MTGKQKKQFGVWMDSQHAIVVGKKENENGDFEILAHEKVVRHENNSSEKVANNSEITELHKFFKNITSHMQNVDEIHVTGTGTAQEQFIKYLSETPQYKNSKAGESTSNKMSDEKLVEYITSHFN
jgi:stalled ribosome rescue protein Dom34